MHAVHDLRTRTESQGKQRSRGPSEARRAPCTDRKKTMAGQEKKNVSEVKKTAGRGTMPLQPGVARAHSQKEELPMMHMIMYGFTFTEFYSFVHDMVLLILVFRAGKNKDAAMPLAKGKRH